VTTAVWGCWSQLKSLNPMHAFPSPVDQHKVAWEVGRELEQVGPATAMSYGHLWPMVESLMYAMLSLGIKSEQTRGAKVGASWQHLGICRTHDLGVWACA